MICGGENGPDGCNLDGFSEYGAFFRHFVATRPPPLSHPITNERFFHRSANTETGARLDVRAQGFWGAHHQQAYFDVRVFNPLATSNRQTTISTCFRSHDREKRRVYEQRVREV